VLNLRDLAVRLGDERPFYGLQGQGVDGKLRPQETIEAMAAQYIAAIREVQPHGPYLLGGYSGGGVIAFEMAIQLRQQGEIIALVALLDTFSPLVPELRYSLRQRALAWWTGGRRHALERVRWWTSCWRYKRWLGETTHEDRVVPIELRDTQLFYAFVAAIKRYQPQVYSGKVTLFRAKNTSSIEAQAGVLLGWDGLAADGIELHETSGGHENFVLGAHADELVATLRDVLRRADQSAQPHARRQPERLESFTLFS
jgi:thioesterase domain-containing protein